MQLIHHNEMLSGPPSAVTIGKFDGVHLGHQALLARARDAAGRLGCRAGVVTFDRHPLEALRPGTAPPYLTTLDERLRLLEEAGAEFCVLLSIASGILDWPAAAFVDRVLVHAAGARHVVSGEDFRYGHGREGSVMTLQAAGTASGFSVEVVPAVVIEGRRVSSYAIRNALVAGELTMAEAMLGRPYSLSGVVEIGRRLGRTLGFPTANVRYDPGCVLPMDGVYAVMAGWGEGAHPAVASLGVRPTVEDGPAPRRLEVHILGFEGDLYDRRMTVSFVRRLRDEQRFESLDALKSRIAEDAQAARAVLGGTDLSK